MARLGKSRGPVSGCLCRAGEGVNAVGLKFRNVDAKPSDDPLTWPFDAVITAVDRGYVSDWRRMVRAAEKDPDFKDAIWDACEALGDNPGADVFRVVLARI